MMDILRFATAGSVDDGKSTLSAACSTTPRPSSQDQIEAVETGQPGPRRRPRQPRAAHRRPARRAGAGHHDRRGLPLLRHAQAEVHHRRHPGAHPVHPQHGDRRLHRRPGPGAGRRPQGDRRAEPAARVPAPRCSQVPHLVLCVNKMDLVDYSQEVYERIHDEFTAFAAKLRVPDLTVDPGVGAQRRQRRHPVGEHAVVRRAEPAAPPGERARRQRPQPHRRPLPGAVRHPAAVRRVARLPRLRRAGRRRRAQAGRRGDGAAVGLHQQDRRPSRPPTARSTRRTRRCR